MAKWNKKGLTPEEKEKRKELLRKQVESVINNFENSPENIVEFLKFSSKFHQYSENNTLLIYEQNNMAQFCASYKAFQDMGYQVQKGQTGMKIFVPYITTVFHDTESDQWIKLSEGTKEQKALVKSGQLESKQFTSFGIGTVFDIGQTDCPPEEYPKLCDMGFASETHQRLYDALVYYAESQNISVEEKFFPSITTRGYYDRGDNSIALSNKLNDSMKLSVMSHELAHAVMHSSEEAAQIPRLQMEIEADSLSLMLRQHLGITEIEDVRQDHLKSAYKNYIELAKSDAGDNEYPDLSKILDNVNKAYLSIIDDFNNTVTNYLEQHKVTVQKLTLNEYLGLHGLSSPVDNFMIDKLKIPHGLTQRQENKLNKQALDASKEYHTRRNTAIKEYYEKVERGEIVEPSLLERTMKAAAGHPDNKSTQAAIRMLEKRGYVKDGQGNWIKSYELTKDFSQSVDDLLNEKLNPHYQIYVCKTTEVMKACGVKDLNVVINQSSIKKILSDDKEKFPHAHNLSVQELKELPIQLQKPIMAFKGSHENSIVFVTDIKDINDNEILISVDINTAGYNQNVNRVTSMYGKDNITNYLKAQIDKGNLIGCDKKRANQMLSTRGLQLPPATTFIDYTDIIPNISENVNSEILPDKQIQDNNSKRIKSTEKVLQNEKNFSQTIDDFLDGKINPYAQIFVCKTTNAMIACGAQDLDIIINQSTLRKIMSNDKSKYRHPHNIDENTIKSIPKELDNPIMILQGSEPSSIVLVSNLTDKNNQNIIISCKLNSEKSIYEVNEITSVYPKNNIANYINIQLNKHNLIGCNKKIANRLLKSLGLQSSEVEASIDYTDIIPDYYKDVNQNNLINDTSLLNDTPSKGENTMEDKIYSPETTIYIENQATFDELTTQPNIRYHFHNHHFTNIKFSDKTIIGHLGGCTLNRCTFENFNGNNIDFSESLFSDCKIINSNFENSVFENAEIRNSQIINSNFNNSIFFLAEIRHSNLDGNNLSAVNFSNAGLIDVHIRNSLINEPVQYLSPEKITMPGATPKEIEIHRSRTLDALKIEPFKEAHPSQDEIDFVAKYEETNLVPDSVRVTEWFGDYGMNVIRPNITEQLFARQLALANEQATSLSGEKNESTKSQQSLPKYELREVAQWSDDRNYLNFSVVIDDYLFDGTFRIADDVNGKGMSIIGINCYSSGQENQVSEIWDELTKQLQEKALQIQNEQSENNMQSHPKIVAEFIQESDNNTNVIMQYPNGLYYNHYGYDFDNNLSQSNAGGFATVEEAKEMMLKHRSDSVEITEPEIFKSSLNNNENVLNPEFEDILNRQLKDTGELPVDVLCDEGKIEWYSFAGAINDTEKVKELLQNIQQKNNQVVSIYNTGDNHQLVCMNNDLNIIPYSNDVYSTTDDALKAVLDNDNIAKLVPYDAMLQASSEQSLLPLSECDNGKYPFVKINWSDNSELAKEGCLPFDKAEELFSSINELCREEGKLERTGISLFLDTQNSYNLEINSGNEAGGINEHLKQLITEGSISNKSLQHLQKYLRENGIVSFQEAQSEHATQMDFFELQ